MNPQKIIRISICNTQTGVHTLWRLLCTELFKHSSVPRYLQPAYWSANVSVLYPAATHILERAVGITSYPAATHILERAVGIIALYELWICNTHTGVQNHLQIEGLQIL